MNYNNLQEISNCILQDLDNLEKQIKIKFGKNNENKIINDFYSNQNHIKYKEHEENNFSIISDFNEVSIQQENEIQKETNTEFILNNIKKPNKEMDLQIENELIQNSYKINMNKDNEIYNFIFILFKVIF